MFRAVDRVEVTRLVSAAATGSMRRAAALRPQPAEHTGPSPDPPPVGAVRDLAGLYEQASPDDRHPHQVPDPYLQLGARK